MRFTPQTKRFALVPVEPGNEKDTDIKLSQECGGGLLVAFSDESVCLSPDLQVDRPIIAALGFPITGEDA